MTSETKIGLVVGLGFIVTFAVILSKKAAVTPYALLEEDITMGEEGQVSVVTSEESPAGKPVSGKSDAEGVAGMGSGTIAKSGPGALGLPNRRDSAGAGEESIVLRVGNSIERGLSGSAAGGLNSPEGGGALPDSAEPAGAGTTEARDIDEIALEDIRLPSVQFGEEESGEEGTVSAGEEKGTGEVVVELEVQPTLGNERREGAVTDKKPAETPTPPEAKPAPAPNKGPSPRTEPATEKEKAKPTLPLPNRRPKFKEYFVKEGDNLIKIARTFFGVSPKEAVDRLYEANKDVLPSRHELQVNQKLRIPAWIPAGTAVIAENFSGAAVHREMKKVAQGEPALRKLERITGQAALKLLNGLSKGPEKKKDTAPKYRWYEVKKNDSFSTIAQSEMGTCKLWKELHAANKQKFPKPESLRVGAKIKIPLTVLARDDGGGSVSEE